MNGQPRQKVVRYLAHIKEKFLWAPAHRQWFWECVDWHLDDLGLDAPMRQRIEETLITVVPRPTPAELEQLERDQRAYAAL